MALIWDVSLSLSQPEFDTTHEEFVELLHAAHRAIDAGNLDNAIRQFEWLVLHTEDHFAQEEQWMQASACPSTESHTKQHATVLRLMREVLRREHEDGLGRHLALVVDELERWFPTHARGLDAALSRHVAAIGLELSQGDLAQRMRATALQAEQLAGTSAPHPAS